MSASLNQLIVANGGIENVSFKVPMIPLHDVGFAKFTSSSDKPVLVTARIDESRYRLEEHYKVTLAPEDSSFGKEHFYQIDLMNSLRRKSIQMLANG